MPCLDTDVVYPLFKKSDWLQKSAKSAAQVKESYVSAILVLEIQLLLKREVGLKESLEVCERLPQRLNIKPFDEDVIRMAEEIRSEHGLGIFDSIHAATALLNDKVMISTDKSYDKLANLKRIDPREL
jgi:predicted nucleic acid-binding protein